MSYDGDSPEEMRRRWAQKLKALEFLKRIKGKEGCCAQPFACSAANGRCMLREQWERAQERYQRARYEPYGYRSRGRSFER